MNKAWLCIAFLAGVVPGMAQARPETPGPSPTPVPPSISSISRINADIQVAEGQHTGDLNTVNGSIKIGPHAQVGKTTTVNGSIRVGAGATVTSLTTVNGSIHVAAQAIVTDSVTAVNGNIRLAPEVQVTGKVTNVNGTIVLDGAHVGGRLETVAGDITLQKAAIVDGGIYVQVSHGWLASWFPTFRKKLRVVIGPGCTVRGTLRFERPVELYISRQAKVGPIEGAKAIYFAGANPPTT